jgi:hypothetical protein
MAQVQEEKIETYDIIKAKYGEAKHFAYPYGRFFHFNKEAMNFVFNTGYDSCASAERGCYFSPTEKMEKDKLLIRRDHVIAKWPLRHIKYFIIQNIRQNNISSNTYPY